MVSRNFDNSSSKPDSPTVGVIVRVCSIFAWVTLLIGIASIFWNNQQVLRGSIWADRSANGAAICVGLIYICSAVLTLWILLRVILWRITLHQILFYFVGIAPFVLVVWGLAEAKFSDKPDHQQASSIVGRVMNLNKLAHYRLFGGSLWQPTTSGRIVQLVGCESTTVSGKLLEQLDTFVDQIRQIAIGSESADAIRLHTRPISSLLVADTVNWVNFDYPADQGDVLTSEQWRSTATAALDGELVADKLPPAFFRLGFIEYFSRSTDEVMDTYFEARSASEFFPAFREFFNDLHYSSTSANHVSFGAAFTTYLLEDRKLQNLSSLWNCSNKEEFESELEKLLETDIAKVEVDFEAWLRSEASRLGWELKDVFHRNLALAKSDNGTPSSMMQRLDSFELGNGVVSENWKTLMKSCEEFHQKRLHQLNDVAFEISARQEKGKNANDVASTKRLRILRRNGERIYTNSDENGERAIAITRTQGNQSERSADSLQRNTRPIVTEQERLIATEIVDQAIAEWFLRADMIAETDRHLTLKRAWKIEKLSNGGTEGLWTLTFTAKDNPDDLVEFKIDPTKAYSVIKITKINDKIKTEIDRVLTRLDADYVVEEELLTTGDNLTSMVPKKVQTTCQIMNELKIGSFSEEMNYMKLKTSVERDPMLPQSSTPLVLSMLRACSIIILSVSGLCAFALALRA